MPVEPGFWAGRRVLVTGNTGFKGSWLTLWLHAMGAEVIGLANGVPTQPALFELARLDELVTMIDADVRDAEAVRRAVADHAPQVLVHLAAQPIVRRSFAEPLETFQTNVMGTVNVLEAVRLAGSVEAVVIVTSDKCYENREWEWAYREYEAMGGFEPYSASKGCAELVTQSYRRSYFSDPDGPRVATARAGNVVGGGDWAADRLLPDIMRAAVAGERVHLRNPESQRPWQHVLNPLSGYLLLAQALHADADFAGAWNFGPPDDEARTVRWIVERVAELWPGGLEWDAAAGPHPPEAQYLKLDSSKARTRLDWAPLLSLGEALESIVAWYAAVRDGEDMREVTLGQIAAHGAAHEPA